MRFDDIVLFQSRSYKLKLVLLERKGIREDVGNVVGDVVDLVL